MADSLSEARERYTECKDALHDQRKQIEEDAQFSDPANPVQWEPEEINQRENNPGGRRPCLTHDQLGQYIQNVSGQVEKAPPALHALPVDSGSDKRVAEKLDGIYRHIEYASRAQQHYCRIAASQARLGVGYAIVRPVVVDAALKYQEPRISSEDDPLRVIFDPWSKELDGSDAECAWHLSTLSERAFKRRWPKGEAVSFDEELTAQSGDDKAIVVAEQWLVSTEKRQLVVFVDAEGTEATLEADLFKEIAAKDPRLQFVREYEDKYRCVKWSIIGGGDEPLEAERIYHASGVGIVPAYGYVTTKNGRLSYCGIARRGREGQKSYNYHASEVRAIQSLAAKAPYLMPLSGLADGSIKALWDKASAETRAYLPYKDWDAENARPIPAPTRAQVSVNLSNHESGMVQARLDIQAALGLYQANLGAPSNETSGVAIESRKQQGEASTANFPSHLSACVTQVGRLVLDMIPRLIDTPRQMRILGVDDSSGSVRVDTKQSEAVVEGQDGGISINPNIGKYDVRVVTGPSYSTQRSQTADALNEVMARNPAMAVAVAPAWAQSLDIPNADKLSQALIALGPPPLKDIYGTADDEESTTALKATIEQLQGKLQEAAQIAQEAQQEANQAAQEADAAKADTAAKMAEAEAKADDVAIKSYEAITKRLDMLIKAMGPEAGAALALATLPPEVSPEVRALLVETIAQAQAQSTPTDEPAEGMGGAPEGPEMGAEMGEPMEQPDPMAEVKQGQEALLQAMGQLIRLVQAKRVRTPERGPDGSITRVVDSIDLAETPAEGPMQ